MRRTMEATTTVDGFFLGGAVLATTGLGRPRAASFIQKRPASLAMEADGRCCLAERRCLSKQSHWWPSESFLKH